MRIKIGDLLVKAGVITELQLKAALAEQQQWGGKLGDILVRMEFLTEEVLIRALSKQTGIARADLAGEVDRAALAVVPPDTAEEYGLVPIALKDQGRTLVVAMSDPLNISATDHLDRKSTRLNSSHGYISYAVFCLKKKKKYIAERESLSLLY